MTEWEWDTELKYYASYRGGRNHWFRYGHRTSGKYCWRRETLGSLLRTKVGVSIQTKRAGFDREPDGSWCLCKSQWNTESHQHNQARTIELSSCPERKGGWVQGCMNYNQEEVYCKTPKQQEFPRFSCKEHIANLFCFANHVIYVATAWFFRFRVEVSIDCTSNNVCGSFLINLYSKNKWRLDLACRLCLFNPSSNKDLGGGHNIYGLGKWWSLVPFPVTMIKYSDKSNLCIGKGVYLGSQLKAHSLLYRMVVKAAGPWSSSCSQQLTQST